MDYDYDDDHAVEDALFTESEVYLGHPWAVAAGWGCVALLCGLLWILG